MARRYLRRFVNLDYGVIKHLLTKEFGQENESLRGDIKKRLYDRPETYYKTTSRADQQRHCYSA